MARNDTATHRLQRTQPPPPIPERARPPEPMLPAPRRGRLAVMGEALKWRPTPIEKPEIDASLPSLSTIERAAETLRYWTLRTEYALSPSGVLREWLKLTLWTAIIVAAPSFLVVPVVTYLLSGFATWTAFFAAAAANLARTMAASVALLVALLLLLGIVRSLFRR